MCNRNIDGGLDNPLIKITNWSLDDFKSVMTSEVLSQITNYYFCSNFGDPMMNNSLIEMCEYSRSISPNVAITIHTNGGARNSVWWRQLAKSLPDNHNVVFALDGLADTHHLYRVGTKFETVLENARTFINSGGTAEWVFLRFKHNEHQVEEARSISIKSGFKKFTVKNSSRFILDPTVKIVDRNNKVMHYIEPATDTPLKFIDKKVIDSYKEIVKNSVISCKVQQYKEVYIDAYKNLYPCCWIASVPYTHVDLDGAFKVRIDMLEQHAELMAKLGDTNVINRSIKDVIDSDAYQTIWTEYWTTNKLIVCARSCGDGNFAKPGDQVANV
jgi:MoaA/NifB/PqqE/SkfB family radical SAM enzyme